MRAGTRFFIGFLVLFAACRGNVGDGHADHDDHAETPDHVELTQAAETSAGIVVGRVVEEVFVEFIDVPARLEIAPHALAKVTSRVPGRIARVPVRLGAEVGKGATLAVIESQALGETRAEYIAAAVKVSVAREAFRREKELVEKGISSESEMRQAQGALAQAQAELDASDARLHALGLSEPEIQALKADDHYSASFPARAPIAGTVIEVNATLGQSVEGTTELFTVADLAALQAVLDVSEKQLGLVHAGEKVVLTTPAYPKESIEGTIEYVGAVVKAKTRTVEVRVVVPDPDHRLKPGMFATARLATTPREQESPVKVVPSDAVQALEDKSVVFAPRGEGRYDVVEVEVGRRTRERAEILRGLEPGDEVVVRGAFILKSELTKASLGDGHAH